MKKLSLSLLALLLALSSAASLSGCSEETMTYSTPDSLEPVAAHMEEELNDPSLTRLNREEIAFSLGIQENEYREGCVLIATSGATIDEIGFFLAAENSADTLQQKLEAYLEECQDGKREWLLSYNPLEAEKLENGRVFRYGDSVFYAFLSEKDMEELDSFVRSYLSAKS